MCEAYINRFERQHGIPHNLLKAISRIESGRNINGQGVIAWPWTINANGTPYVFNTKAEAVAKVRELKSQGINSIDVGCMQINLKHHPDAFQSLEAAFDPSTNIAYAARFLREKMEAQGTWQGAVAHYHSASTTHNQPYKNKVMTVWEQFNNGSLPTSQTPMETLFTINQPAEANTQFRSLSGRSIPVRVRFSPHMGYKRSIQKVSTNITRPSTSIVNTKFTRTAGGRPIKANTAISAKRIITPLIKIRRANITLPPKV